MKTFSHYRTALAMLLDELPGVTGDFGLTYVEFLGQGNKSTYLAHMAPVHLHIGKHYHTMTITDNELKQMMMLDPHPYEVGSYYLAPLDALFTQPPSFMAGKELGFVRAVNFHEPDQWTVRVSPATPYLAGAFWNLIVPTFSEDEMFLEIMPIVLEILPIKRILRKLHVCRQQGKGFEFGTERLLSSTRVYFERENTGGCLWKCMKIYGCREALLSGCCQTGSEVMVICLEGRNSPDER